MASEEAQNAVASGIGKLFSAPASGGGGGGGGGGADGAAGAALNATPYGAALSAVSSIANSPPPSSAATLRNGQTFNVNPSALNLGSILQPFTQGGTPNGGSGYNVTSPMGSASATISSASNSTKIALYAAGGIVAIAITFILARRT